jgi:hypothetical protein
MFKLISYCWATTYCSLTEQYVCRDLYLKGKVILPWKNKRLYYKLIR